MGHSAGELDLAPLYISGGNVGIGTTDPGTYKLKVAGNARIEGNLEVTGIISGKEVPRYRVKYTSTVTDVYTISGFSSAPYEFSVPSFGSIKGSDREYPDGSYLFEMKVNALTSVTKTLRLFWIDNRVDFFMDNIHIAGPWGVADYRTNPQVINFVMSPGLHTIQIIFNPQGGDDYLAVFGDIVDNQNAVYVPF